MNHPAEGIEKELDGAKRMLLRAVFEMSAYILLLYAALGLGAAIRLKATRALMVEACKRSLALGFGWSAVFLVAGIAILVPYMLHIVKSPKLFEYRVSPTLLAAFRAGAVLGVPVAVYTLRQVLFPLLKVSPAAAAAASDWTWLLHIVAALVGWFAGRAIGGITGLAAIVASGPFLLRRFGSDG